MIDYRRITEDDVSEVVRFALEGITLQPHPGFHISLPKIRANVERCALSPGDFNLAAFDGSKMVGGLWAAVCQMPFFERFEAHIGFCYATLPGVGMRLLRSLFAWFNADIKLRRLVWVHNEFADARVMKLAARAGFGRTLHVSVAHKGE